MKKNIFLNCFLSFYAPTKVYVYLSVFCVLARKDLANG